MFENIFWNPRLVNNLQLLNLFFYLKIQPYGTYAVDAYIIQG